MKQNCPAYRDIQINAEASGQLPEDGNVLDDILTLDGGGDDGDLGPPDGDGLHDNGDFESAFQRSVSSVVPDLLVDRSKRDLLTSQLDL